MQDRYHRNHLYTAYYYDPSRDLAPGIDSNGLYVNGKFVHMITSVNRSSDLSRLIPERPT